MKRIKTLGINFNDVQQLTRQQMKKVIGGTMPGGCGDGCNVKCNDGSGGCIDTCYRAPDYCRSSGGEKSCSCP